MNYTIDASVFVSAIRLQEAQYASSRAFLRQIKGMGTAIICPTLILPECAAAIARRTRDAALVEEISILIENFRGLQLFPLTLMLARRAAQLASIHYLRGADSI